jgi:hypothetical protein
VAAGLVSTADLVVGNQSNRALTAVLRNLVREEQ